VIKAKRFISILLLLTVLMISCKTTNPEPVVINCVYTVEPQIYMTINSELAFTDKSTITDGNIISWNWTFDDGSTSNLKNPTHTYTSAKTYNVSLTVKDDQNNSKSYSKRIVVSDPNKGLRRILYQTSDTVYVCAHRAVHLTLSNVDYPENSMTAINVAIANKIDLFECDVRNTVDGVLVLLHDATVDRTTNGTGTLNKMYYADVKKLKLKNYTSNALTTDTVPTLKQVLATSKNQIFIALDIDGKASVADVLKMVQDMDMVDNVMFFTASQTDVSYLISNGAIAMPSCYNNNTYGTYIQNNLKPLIFQTDISGYNEEWISMKTGNIKIYDNVYLLTSTLPTTDNWAQLNVDLQNGVNIVQTDYPIEMLAYLKSKRKH
jgi:glycerophosphoryl diester phosphodiesterase